jgi:hypothetical protein
VSVVKLAGNYYVTEVDPRVLHNAVHDALRHRLPLTLPTIGDLAGSCTASAISVAVIGVVSNTDDPDGAGRVKVKFPSAGDNIEERLGPNVMPHFWQRPWFP